MGKSFIFKDSSGRTAGYLVQGMGRLCCRADMLAQQGARLCLLYADGGTAQYELAADGGEQTIEDAGRMIAGAAILAQDAPPLGSDAQTLCIILQREAERKRAAHSDAQRQKTPPASEPCAAAGDEAKDGGAKGSEAKAMCDAPTPLLQRRWPPPPCWPRARYAHGRWQEDTQQSVPP